MTRGSNISSDYPGGLLMDAKRYSPSFSPSDIKRLEEAFLDNSHRNKKSPGHRKFPHLPLIIILALILALIAVYFKFSVIVVPKMSHPEVSLLNTRYLESISLISKEGKIQFAQGIIYLPLLPGTPQGFVIGIKKPLDLEKNDIYLEGTFLEGSSAKDFVRVKAIIRDDKFFSNAVLPLETKIETATDNPAERLTTLKLDFKSASQPHMNLSRITQIRFEFYNPRNTPVSLLIKEIKVMRKEDE